MEDNKEYFSIISVDDYKGGTLDTYLNLTREDLVKKLLDMPFFDYYDYIITDEIETEETLIKYIRKGNKRESCTYSDGELYRVYKSFEGKIVEVTNWEFLIPDLIEGWKRS